MQWRDSGDNNAIDGQSPVESLVKKGATMFTVRKDFDYQKRVPGIYDITINDYHHTYIDIISKSYLYNLSDCPANAKVPTKVTPAMILGRAVHKLALEGGEAFDAEYAIMPDYPDTRETKTKGWKNTNEYKAQVYGFIADHVGKEIIDMETYLQAKAMTESVFSNPAAADIIGNGLTEVSMIWQHSETGLWVKSRPDCKPNIPGTLADLKKVSKGKAKKHAFQSEIVRYMYHVQAAMALEAATVLTGERYDLFAFIVVEDEPPYKTMVEVLDDEFIHLGHQEFNRLMRIENHCREQNFWPAYEPTDLMNLRHVSPGLMLAPGYLKSEKPWENEPTEM